MNYRVGLANLGNTCFLNSCIQVLQHTYEIHSLCDQIETPEKGTSDVFLMKEWDELRKVMQRQDGTLSPNRFVHVVQQVAQQKGRDLFTGWAQNDISEFLFFLVESMHNSLSRPLKILVSGQSENDTDRRAILCYSFLKEVFAKEYSPILDIFYGMYVTELVDPVSKEILSTKPEHYFILDLQLFSRYLTAEGLQDRPCKTIYECLDLFVSSEILHGDNAWWNEATEEKQTVGRQVSFWNFPNILVLSLKRFSPDGERKLQTLVDFPLEHLDLSRYIKGYKASSNVFDLFGVCNHMGGVMGGHYTAYVKNGLGQWNHYNDTMVEPVTDLTKLVSPTAYCLFYRKKIPSRSI
jgi:ubiquitin C-terminal hydrolase